MTDVFTASNGVTVQEMEPEEGFRRFMVGGNTNILLTNAEVVAAREFIQHKEDTRLNRWRSKEHPGWTAVVSENGRHASFRHEDGLHSFTLSTTYPVFHAWTAELQEVGREYFSAHPVTPPPAWHEAKAGEVWVAIVAGREVALTVMDYVTEGVVFMNHSDEEMFSLNAPDITAAHRIWPATDFEETES